MNALAAVVLVVALSLQCTAAASEKNIPGVYEHLRDAGDDEAQVVVRIVFDFRKDGTAIMDSKITMKGAGIVMDDRETGTWQQNGDRLIFQGLSSSRTTHAEGLPSKTEEDDSGSRWDFSVEDNGDLVVITGDPRVAGGRYLKVR